MKNIRLIVLPTILICTTGADPLDKYQRRDFTDKAAAKLQSLTPDAVAAAVTNVDDDLEPIAVLSTVKAFFDRGRFTDPVRSDNFLRAFIHKKTGTVRYQVYQSLIYSVEWRFFELVNYATPDGPKTASVTRISQRPTCSSGMCVYEEDVGFDVSEEELRSIAETYVPGKSTLWRFRFKSKTLAWEDAMSPAEAMGILNAVERWKAAHPVK